MQTETRFYELLRHVREMRKWQQSYFASAKAGRPDMHALVKSKRAETNVDRLISGQRSLLEEAAVAEGGARG